jgi:hypothetical protein
LIVHRSREDTQENILTITDQREVKNKFSMIKDDELFQVNREETGLFREQRRQ